VAAVLALLVLVAGVVSTTLLGGRVRELFGRVPLLPAERLLVDHAAGLSVVSLVGALLGFAGLFHAPLLVGLLFSGALADPRRLLRFGHELAAAASNLRPRSAVDWVLTAGVGLVGFATLIGAGLPEVFFDSLIYQLGLPAQWLVAGRLFIEPSMVQSAWPASVGVLFACHLAAGGTLAAQLFAWWGLPASAVAVVLLARRLGAPRRSSVGVLGALVLVSVPGLGIASTMVAIDQGLLLLAAVALLALAVHRRTGSLAPVVLAALAVGTMVAAKYTALYFLVAAVVLLSLPPWRGGLVAAARRAILFAVLALALASPWYLRSFVVMGNPVHPAFSSQLGGDADAIHAERRLAQERTSFERSPRGALRALTVQLRDAGGLGWGAELGWLLPLVLVVLVVSAFPRSPLAPLRAWLLLSAVVWLLWFSLQPGARYLFPVYPIAAIGIGWLLHLALRTCAALRGSVLLLLAIAVSLNLRQVAVIVSSLHAGARSPAAVWSALVERDAHLDRVLDYWSAADWLNRTTPPDARILLLGETRVLYFERSLVFSSAYDRHVVQRWMEDTSSPDELLARLRAEGVTHVLINWFEVERLGHGRGHLQLRADESRILLGALDSLTRVFADGRVEVRALPAPVPPDSRVE
jgi:hypothetical protein